MGNFVSAAVSAFTDLMGDIEKTATDVGKTAGQLQGIAAGFAAPVTPPSPSLRGGQAHQRHMLFASSSDIPTALKAARTGASQAVSDKFTAEYAKIDAAGSDSGAVAPFDVNGDISHVVSTIKQNFTNWNLPVDENIFLQMANTMKTEVYNTPTGDKGVSYGSNYINGNQKVDWVVAYGIFLVDAAKNLNGLVYAFTAGLDSGWETA